MDWESLRLVGSWGLVVIGLLFMLWFLGRVAYLSMTKDRFAGITRSHFAAVIGLPLAAIGCLFLVLVSEKVTQGPIVVKGLGFQFEGAAGPVILWAICIVAVAVCIRLLWPCTMSDEKPTQTQRKRGEND